MPRVNNVRRTLGSRANGTVWFLLVIFLIILLQDRLSDEVKVGQLLPDDVRTFFAIALTNRIWLVVKLIVLIPGILFWILNREEALRKALLVSLLLLTFELLAGVAFLALGLTRDTSRAAIGLIRDTLIVGLINILTFSLWYWIVDGYRNARGIPPYEPDEFLFPPYTTALPRLAHWVPRYVDYLFLAFTTTTAFGPTDTLPLTRRAKVLMMAQAALSLVIIVVLAGRALSILR